MAKFQTTINKFNGGIAEDSFAGFANEFEFAKHMDIFSQDGRMRPYRSIESDQTGQIGIGNLLFVDHDSNLYGLGIISSGLQRAKIYKKSGTNVVNDNWAAAATGESSFGAVNFNMFVEYKGALYFWSSFSSPTATIGKYDIDSPVAGDVTSWNTVTTTAAMVGVTQGAGIAYHFELNNRLYFSYGNKLAMLDGTSFTAEEFVLPDEYYISSITGWGDYLAIGVRRAGGKLEGSRVFFWNTVDADPSFVRNIPDGALKILRNVGNELAAVTTKSITAGSAIAIDASFSMYTYNGGEFIKRKELIRNNDGTHFTQDKYASVHDNELYFAGVLGSDTGIWRFGFKDNRYVFTLDKFVTNDNSEVFSGFGDVEFVGDYFFAVHTANGTITRTNDQNTHSVIGIYRTLKLDGGQKYMKKKLDEVAISTASLPVGTSVEVKYQTDDSGSFTSLFTHDTDGKVKKVIKKIDGISEYTYIQFQCEVTGFAEITELSFIYHDVPNEIEE